MITIPKQSSNRSQALASRLEAGAKALANLAAGLSDAEWHMPVPGDGRKTGVIIHHVASVYPIEIHLASLLASGQAITGVTWDAIHEMNRTHAEQNAFVSKEETLEMLARNSAGAAAAIRTMTDDQLDRAAPVSLNGDAPLTCQFFLEDHPVRHSYHHLAQIRMALASPAGAAA